MALLERSSFYKASDHLMTGTGVSNRPSVVHFEAGQAAHEQLILAKLGANGWGRWQYFRRYFSGGWGEKNQKPLSPKSQDLLFKALDLIEFQPSAKPSLFLTDDGYFELAWRDEDGKSIQLEFGPRESEIYLEASETELTFQNRDLAAIVAEHL